MKIEQRGSSYRFQKMINGKRKSFTFDHKPTQKEINQAIREAENSSVTLSNAPRKSFRECAEEYLSVKSNVLSASTIRSYKCMLNSMPDNFKEKTMSEIDQIAIQKYVNDMTETHKPKSIKNHHAFISAVVKMFCPDMQINTTLPKIQKEEKYIPTSDDIKAVLSQCRKEKYRIIFLLGCNGLRRSEILALTLNDIGDNFVNINKAMVQNSDNEWIVQPYTKTESSTRIVPIDNELAKAIRKQGYIFDGHPCKIIEYLNACQVRAGVPKFRFHDLRHFYATELMRSGKFTNKDIQKLGGWSSDNVMAKIYQHERISKDKEMQLAAAQEIKSLLE